MVRRPSLSLNEDHHRGKIAILSMYRAIDKFVMVAVVFSSLATWESEAGRNPSDSDKASINSDGATYGRRSSYPKAQRLLLLRL